MNQFRPEAVRITGWCILRAQLGDGNEGNPLKASWEDPSGMGDRRLSAGPDPAFAGEDEDVLGG